MESEEKYAQCRTVKELNNALEVDCMKFRIGVITREEMINCELMYSERFKELFISDMKQTRKYEE